MAGMFDASENDFRITSRAAANRAISTACAEIAAARNRIVKQLSTSSCDRISGKGPRAKQLLANARWG
jgi:hypothetical protein